MIALLTACLFFAILVRARENDRSSQYNRSESPASEVVGKVQKYSNLLGKVQGTF